MSKVVLITGGSSGIGKSIGNYLTEKGFKVYGTSRNPDSLTQKLSFQIIQLDVTKPHSIKEAISKVIENENRIDVLINNAGVGITGPIEETPDIEIKKAFETNFYGPLNVIKEVLPKMRSQKSGLILNITSIAGYMGLPYRGLYSASKAALDITTEAYRMEVKQFGIEMATIAPGDFATNIASGRYHCPEIESSPYKDSYGKTLQMMNDHVSQGEDPIEMAKKVNHIINSSQPKVAYKVGSFLQKFSIVLKRILPSKMYEKMLMNHYKLK